MPVVFAFKLSKNIKNTISIINTNTIKLQAYMTISYNRLRTIVNGIPIIIIGKFEVTAGVSLRSIVVTVIYVKL